AVAAAIGPDSLPQKLDRALGTIVRQHAGAPQLQKPAAGVPRNQRFKGELAVGIEPAGGRGAILRQQAIGADDPAAVAACCRIDDEQMVAYGVELVRVEPLGSRFTAGMPLLVEHLETQLLR